MRDSTMMQYLAQVKTIVDNIAAAGSQVDVEDIILYILNGLPSSYNAFKTSIRTSLQPISLDTLYSLLCSEEVDIQSELQRESIHPSDSVALFSNRGTSRGRPGSCGFKVIIFVIRLQKDRARKDNDTGNIRRKDPSLKYETQVEVKGEGEKKEYIYKKFNFCEK
ncbi:hypothetical protein M5K25_024726 [Dendrobium thyrsiflorum]|uniref:Retrovirus-related Pol polyprotein from transposon TNT 1-94 n=1 Tax=Dendrobium thyrsiflorum TaxID=117978 RepID=A0ABD0U2N8_DENTH